MSLCNDKLADTQLCVMRIWQGLDTLIWMRLLDLCFASQRLSQNCNEHQLMWKLTTTIGCGYNMLHLAMYKW